MNRQALTMRIVRRDIKMLEHVKIDKINISKINIFNIIRTMTEETPLTQRIAELKELSQAIYPNTPEWYIILAVENYIKEHEAELLEYADQEDDNKPDVIITEDTIHETAQ